MGIRRLEISGFRSLAEVKWEPGPLNLLIGVNGSGKSNLLRALMLLQAAAEGRLAETVRRMGGMVPLLWDGKANTLRIALESGMPGADKVVSVTYALALRQLGQSGAYSIQHESLADCYKNYKGSEVNRQLLLREEGKAQVLRVENGGFGREIEINTAFDEREALLSQGIEVEPPTRRLFSKWLAGLCTYHDVRVDAQSEIRRATLTRLEQQVEDDGSNLIAVLHTLYSNEKGFRESLNSAMRAAFGDEFEELIFPPAEDGRVQLRLRWRSLKRAQSAADLSDGTLRFLFLITVLANPAPPSLIAIDEPETGLHPSMFPIIAEHAVEASKRTQVILTTHSPQFLNAFSVFPDVTTVAELHEGKTVLRRLPGDKLEKWLEHYQLGELMMSGELESMD